MYSLLFTLLFSFSLSAFAIPSCGNAPVERKHNDLTWYKAITVTVNNSFQDTAGIICVGILKTDPKVLNRITYRDIDGRVIDADLPQLKAGIVLVQDKDLPPAASFVLRPGQYVVVKMSEPKAGNGVNVYPFSLRLLRNLSNGSGAKDFRELPFNGVVDYTNSTVTTTFGQSTFDEVELNLSTFPVLFTDIYFYQAKAVVSKTHAMNLKQIPSLF